MCQRAKTWWCKKEKRESNAACNDDYWFMPKDWSQHSDLSRYWWGLERFMKLWILSTFCTKLEMYLHKCYLAQEAENIHQKANMQSWWRYAIIHFVVYDFLCNVFIHISHGSPLLGCISAFGTNTISIEIEFGCLSYDILRTHIRQNQNLIFIIIHIIMCEIYLTYGYAG